MNNEKCYQATPKGTLLEQLVNPCCPKSEREWVAAREIERIQAELADLTKEHTELESDYTDQVLRAHNAEAELAALKGQEPVAWVYVVDRHEGPYNFNGQELLDSGRHNLYRAAGAQERKEQP